MKDETYVFISDVKDKKITARSARHQRTHTGKGGRVRLPSDNLSKKELLKMSGECKSYRLNAPMNWDEFKAMPDDIKISYIKLLREKYDVPDRELCRMFGTNKDAVSRLFKKLGLNVPGKRGSREWKKEEWLAWVNGVDMPTAPVEESIQEEVVITSFDPDPYVEEDLPFEEPISAPVEAEYYKPIPVTAVPTNGSMSFTCPANQALNTLAQLLGEANVSISVMWRVVEEGGAEDD